MTMSWRYQTLMKLHWTRPLMNHHWRQTHFLKALIPSWYIYHITSWKSLFFTTRSRSPSFSSWYLPSRWSCQTNTHPAHIRNMFAGLTSMSLSGRVGKSISCFKIKSRIVGKIIFGRTLLNRHQHVFFFFFSVGGFVQNLIRVLLLHHVRKNDNKY